MKAILISACAAALRDSWICRRPRSSGPITSSGSALRGRELHLVGFARHLASLRGNAGTPLAPSTQAQYLAVVKAFFGFLERRRVLLVNPAAGIPLPVK